MAGSKTQFLERSHLDGTLGGPNYNRPPTVYIALFTAMANPELGLVTEISEPGYVRQSVTNDATHWPAAAAGDPSLKTNGTVIVFPDAQNVWPPIVGFGVYDGPLGSDNLLYWGDVSKLIGLADRPTFGIGALMFTEY